MANNENTLIEDFELYFRIELVSSEARAKEAYGVRYRVYCEEFKYEATDVFPDQLETDEFDAQSLHCLIIHKGAERERTAGCVRLVPVCPEKNDGLLPLEEFCQQSLDDELIASMQLVREEQCEISRLAVDGEFRRRPGEKATRFGETQQEQRTFSLIAVSAFLAAFALGIITKKTGGFAMMEPFLPRLLKRSGILFEKVGSDMDYHGIRAPYFISKESLLENMVPELKGLYDWIYKQVEVEYNNSQVSRK